MPRRRLTPYGTFEEAIAATEKALWQLREALQEEDQPLLRQVLRETFSKIVLYFEHYQRKSQQHSRLLRGEAYVRPQEQYADLFPTGA
jgi:hypothetical protein